MLGRPLELFLLLAVLAVPVSAIAALIVSLRTRTEARELRRQLDCIEAELALARRREPSPAAGERPGAPVESGGEVAAPGRPAPAPVAAPAAGEPRAAQPPPGDGDEPTETAAPPRAAASGAADPTGAARRPVSSRLGELEWRLGARLPVWIGAVALALAGAFLVKLSFDRGWLGPPVRIALGLVFGSVLLGAGEWLRRRSAWVAQGLAAAGISVLFVSFWAAVDLYGLLAPAAGFLFMALTTAVAVLLSLRQGPMVAALGLIGGFLTPALIRTDTPDARTLFLYLLLLQAGLLAVGRRKGWTALSVVSFAAGLLWVLVWLEGESVVRQPLWIGLFVLGSVALYLARRSFGAAEEGPLGRILPWLVPGGGLLALAALVARDAYRPLDWLFLGLLGAGCLVLARRDEEQHAIAWVAAVVSVGLLGAWAADRTVEHGFAFLDTCIGIGLLYGAGAYTAHWRSRRAPGWAWLSAASGVALLLIAFYGSRDTEPFLPWGALALILAVLYLVAAVPVARRRAALSTAREAFPALAVAVTALVSLALPMELERQWLTVAWALEVAALVWLADRLSVLLLDRLAWLLATAVGVRLLLNPDIALGYPIGSHPLFNWLSYGYGIPILALGAAAFLASAAPSRRRLAEWLRWETLALGVVFAGLLVRQRFHPGALAYPELPLTEIGALVVVWMLLACMLRLVARRWPLAVYELGGLGLGLLATAVALVGPAVVDNPAWSHHPVGSTPVLNHLLWVYGLPAALTALLARLTGGRAPRWAPPTFAVCSLLFAFLLLTLEVRQAFRGAYLDVGGAGPAEQYAYSAAWALFGVVLLAAGIVGRRRLLRVASLAVMLLAAGKVFLFDVGRLGDVYRVLSFLGLGASLLLIAYLYQRFVARE